MEQLIMPVTREQIRHTARRFLDRACTGQGAPHTLGHHWLERFLQRRPDLFVRKPQNLAFERKNAHDVPQTWFDALLEIKIRYGIVDDDQYNMDDTGFQIGLSGSR